MKISVAAMAISLGASMMSMAQTSTITIDGDHVENHVSPRMYASFVEMMAEDVKRGMTAEMIRDRSFEEATDYLGLPAGWQLEPDERNDNVAAVKFAQTSDEAYPTTSLATGASEHALRITVTPEDITDTRRGLSQGHLSVVAGQTYNGYLWINLPTRNRYTGAFKVALEEDNTDGEIYANVDLPSMVGEGWQRYPFSLTPSRTDRFAKLSILFDGKGILYLDQVSLESAAAVGHVRPDTEAMVQGLHPSFMRWPGGNVAQDYHWRWGIGPRDLRPTWVNKAWSNAPEPDDLGTDEYLALCSRLHIEPSITVNVNGAGATPDEAAAWVEYVNGPVTSKFGAMRAANGHSAPYGVKQWELGNEIFGDWVRGHVTAEQYAEAALVYAHAMRAIDPSIRLIAVGEGLVPNSDAWNSSVLRIAGSTINYLAVHDYTSLSQNATKTEPRAAMMGRAGEFEANYRHLGDLIERNAPGRGIKLIVNEWNLFYDADTVESMDGAVYASRMMNGFERVGDIVEANCISDLLNGWIGGVIQASRDRIYGTPQYYVVKMYADSLGTDRLHAEVSSPNPASGLKNLDAVASRSADRSKVFVKMSNADPVHKISTTIDLRGSAHTPDVELDIISSIKPQQRNSFRDPETVIPSRRILRCPHACIVDLPPLSVAVMTFHHGS